MASTKTSEIEINNTVDNNVIDVDLSVIAKKRFRFNKDDNKILELNTSDMNIVNRLDSTYKKLDSLAKNAQKTIEDSTEDTMGEAITAIDTEMRELVDYIFDANVSDVLCDGSMYDMFEGAFRFEHIITKLLALYEDNIAKEAKKLKTKVAKHTDKYTKK